MSVGQAQFRSTLFRSTPSAHPGKTKLGTAIATPSYAVALRLQARVRASGVQGTAQLVASLSMAAPAEYLGWLSELYSLIGANKNRKAGILLYDRMDRLLAAGQFGECDEVLRTVRFDILGPLHSVGFLTITSGYRDRLLERPAYFCRVAKQVREAMPDRADRILAGLE